MAHKRKKTVGKMDNTTMLLLIGGGVLGLILLMNSNKSSPAPAVVRTALPSGNATTAAEIAAGASVINTALNDFSSDDNS
jgi:hypothetical protein